MNNMSEIHCQKVAEHARAMTEEDLQIFLQNVPRKLLIGELDRRLQEKETLDAGLSGLISKYEK